MKIYEMVLNEFYNRKVNRTNKQKQFIKELINLEKELMSSFNEKQTENFKKFQKINFELDLKNERELVIFIFEFIKQIFN